MRKPGKKIGVLPFIEGANDFNLELRLDGEQFYAEIQGEEFRNRDLHELKKALRARAKDISKYEWRRYLVVECDVTATGNQGGSWGKDIVDLKDEDRVSGVRFNFDVVDRTQPIKSERNYDGRTMFAYLEQEVYDLKGKLTPAKNPPRRKSSILETRDSPIPKEHADAIPFTEERYATLVAIREAMKSLAVRLHAVVGEPTKAAVLLDGFKIGRLLAAPKGGE